MKKLWLLDPGHGGLDSSGEYVTQGKRSPIWDDGSVYYEGVGNRDITKRIARGALLKGIDTMHIVTPSDSRDVSLGNRVRKANRLFEEHKNAVYVSIHSNGFKRNIGEGWSVYTSKGETKSDLLASMLYLAAAEAFPGRNFRKDFSDGDPDKEANFYVLKNTHMPALLSENFFHTHEKECKEILMTEEGRQKIANMHLSWMEKIDKHPEL